MPVRTTSSCLPALTSAPYLAVVRAPHAMHSLAQLLPYAIVAHYASVAADTFSSELGILSKATPVLITDLNGLTTFNPKRVPRGTNGGVTALGTAAGLGGAALMAVVAVMGMPLCPSWTVLGKALFFVTVSFVGCTGSLLDSVLGALLQSSIVDMRTSKVVEGPGGSKVRLLREAYGTDASKKVINGSDILSNNGVNLLMCSIMSLSGVLIAFLISRAQA